MAGASDLPLIGGLFAPKQDDQGPYIEYYQNMADGTHLVRQSVDPQTKKAIGAATDEGLQAAKSVPTDKPVVKALSDGSTWVFAFNPDGTVKSSTQLAPPSGAMDALTEQRDAKTQQIDQQLANAEAMLPYNKAKAQATIDNLNARTDLTADQKQLLQARVSRISSQNAVDASRIGLNEANTNKSNAQTNLYTAEGQMKLKNAFYQAQQEINTLYGMVGQPGGPPDKAAADQLAQQIYDRTAREAATGISAAQETANALTAQRQAMEQGNNRASEAGADFRNMQTTGLDIAKSGGSAAGISNFLQGSMALAPSLQAQMGGAPVSISGGFTNQHFQQVLGLLKSGQVPPDPQGNYVPNAVRITTGQQPVTAGGAAPVPAPAPAGGVPPGYQQSPSGGPAGAPGSPDSFLSLGGS